MSITRYDSKSNTVPFINLSEDDIIRIVNKALSSGNSKHTTSYKYAFFKSILDNVFNVDLDTGFMSFDSISLRFTEIYWNLVLRYHLRQGNITTQYNSTGVEKKLFEFCSKYSYSFEIKETICAFEGLCNEQQLELNKSIKSVMMKNVVGAFCGDTDDQFYHFDKSEYDGIELHPDVLRALIKYKGVFEKQNYYEWIKYLEKTNKEEDAYALANKLDRSTERNNLGSYRKVLQDFNQTRCFYCGKPLDQDDKNQPVDHFIPWSFVKDDKLWNFVLACPHCNSSKSNILPDLQYFESIKERNNKLVKLDLPLVKHDFKNYSYTTLMGMWHSAVFNGYDDGWKVK